ncbi:hypothetical protein RHMOL_Rhmol04G0239900 [Rhododendron molle]|nr:hypothetical protein RHMOL_Rhmol04G0239900 [Rhododendron molle]
MLAYFCFLEQLLVTRLGSGAIAISLPFSCIMGLLASMTSTTMGITMFEVHEVIYPFSRISFKSFYPCFSTLWCLVKRKFAWLYATIQFGLVVLFAHLFYSLLRVEAVLSVVVATVAGFGGTMVGTCVLLGLFKAMGRRQPRSNQHQGSQEVPQLHQLSETAHTPETDPRLETETMDSRIERSS